MGPPLLELAVLPDAPPMVDPGNDSAVCLRNQRLCVFLSALHRRIDVSVRPGGGARFEPDANGRSTAAAGSLRSPLSLLVWPAVRRRPAHDSVRNLGCH